ncbi:hypothetical protein CNR22_02040 [Sphingobacteriaceae bacterium]|nr:hypothetical protein CNR22_02040 [Sphingobacteriaceae bacterium]
MKMSKSSLSAKSKIHLFHSEDVTYLLDTLTEGVQVIDHTGRYLYVNAVFSDVLETPVQQLVMTKVTDHSSAKDNSIYLSYLEVCIKKRIPQHFDYEFTYPDKSSEWLSFDVKPIKEGILVVSRQITSLTKAEKKLKKALHLNTFISQVNQHIVRIKDQAGLFKNACRIAIEFGKFRMAWIGLFDFKVKTIHVVDHYGMSDKEFVLFKKIHYQKHGPQDHVLRTKSYYICNDIENEPELESWRPFAQKYHIRSCIILPVMKENVVIGTFNLYSEEINFSNQGEIDLFIELAGDISYALDKFAKLKRQQELENLLIQNEKRYRALIEKGSDMITLVKENGELIYCSASVTKVLGYSQKELLHNSDITFVHPKDRKAFIEHIRKIASEPGASFSNQQRLLHKDGHSIYCEGTVTNMLHEPGLNAIVSSFRDITERKLAERKLKRSEAFTSGILNSLSSHIAVVDEKGTIIAVNETWNKFALENDGIDVLRTGVGSNYFDVCAQSQLEGVQDATLVLQGLKDVMSSKSEDFYLEYPCHSPDKQRWFGMRIIKFDGDEPMLVVAHQDISQRKLAEENLTKSEASLNEAQGIAHLGNWEMNLYSQEVFWSNEAYRIFGIPQSDKKQIYSSWIKLIHENDLASVTAAVKEARENFTDTILNYRIRLKDGQIKHINTKSKFKFNAEGVAVGLLGIVLDVTDKKIAEEEKEKMVADIILHSKNLEQFAYIVSHNLRAPIANILGLASLLKGTLTEKDRATSQEYLFVAVEKLDETVQDLNKILSIRAEITENRELISLTEIVNSIGISIQNEIEKEHVKILTDFTAVDKIETLKSYVHSIFFNLITNSIKYRQPAVSPVILIRAELLKGRIRISVKDNGLGIDLEQNREKVFGLYKRFHLSKEGKGLGLFMTRTQVEVLGGSIVLESKPGFGTEFIIELPL